MNPKSNEKHIDDLYAAILTLETREECVRFFGDLCTSIEIDTLAQRFEVAKMLRESHIYADIVNATGASTATISRVNRSINYGNGGYDIALERIKENDAAKSDN
ncbi:MAG: YerC/YecD family TrpR-related protein [Oscillospiraceae bacterium]|nr:YerC/YecD family TrpR-related protein [Ruminococcus sp.]MCD8344704.1 YerC/YecD family TrpR-related protein [Oscillospiraceae bacterium]